jgi:hypothetical protein
LVIYILLNSINCVDKTKDGIVNYILDQSFLLFYYYV